jgi:hypothetical protein
MKLILVLILMLQTRFALSQDCDCFSQFKFVKDYYENNNPAFQKIRSNKKSFSLYTSSVKKISTEIRLKNPGETCTLYFDKYINLLKDHHSGIGYNLKRLDFSTENKIAEFKKTSEYNLFKKIDVDTTEIKKNIAKKKASDIEGIYSNGGNIEFGVLKKENANNEFIGVILKKTKLLEIGHIIIEFKRVKDNLYDCIYNIGLLGFNFNKIYKQISIKDGQMQDFGFAKIMQQADISYEFKALDDKTNYLRLSSFDDSFTNELDSFYKSIDIQLKSKPFLIIDIRNNGGGNEQSYFSIMPYIYTNPMKVDSVLVWVSPENIRHYETIYKESNPKLIERMKSAKLFSFISQIEGATSLWEMDSVYTFPKKVALIYNRGTASSAESMITYCMQSSKVITIGENSGGYMGYGDVITSQTPCGKITLRSTSTKYHSNSKYEFVGIKPMFNAVDKNNWIDYAKVMLSETK